MKMKPGKYQHYKGPMYEVIDTVRHSETEEWMVLYRPLYDDEQGLWVRPYDMFLQSVSVDGVQVPRFRFLGEEWGDE